jgi:hypothetical protein
MEPLDDVTGTSRGNCPPRSARLYSGVDCGPRKVKVNPFGQFHAPMRLSTHGAARVYPCNACGNPCVTDMHTASLWLLLCLVTSHVCPSTVCTCAKAPALPHQSVPVTHHHNSSPWPPSATQRCQHCQPVLSAVLYSGHNVHAAPSGAPVSLAVSPLQ